MRTAHFHKHRKQELTRKRYHDRFNHIFKMKSVKTIIIIKKVGNIYKKNTFIQEALL